MNPSNYSSISFPFLGLEMNPPRTLCLGPLNIHLYGIAIGLGLCVVPIVETVKFFQRRAARG